VRARAELEQRRRQAASQGQGNSQYDWTAQARPEQIAPAWDWRTWLVLAGRGWGKTRTGAEWVRRAVVDAPIVNLIGATADDARDIMIEGPSGILAICPPKERPRYLVSKRQLVWPNGAKSLIFTADEPERLRGKQHYKLWGDELGSWRYPEAWTQAMLGLRLGSRPQVVVTTTPRPTKLIRDLMAAPTTHVTRGSTYDNRTNLAPEFLSQIVAQYEGTRIGRQELHAEILDDNPGALWKRSDIEQYRVTDVPTLQRIVVAIDPTATATGDEAGIIVAGVAMVGRDRHLYVLDDVSTHGSPHVWASAAVAAYNKWRADRIVAEVNNGGEMVEATIRIEDPRVAYKSVYASRGKATRAEPIAAVYEQGRGHHVGMFAQLEDELCQWEAGSVSPNRLDALVWAATDLALAGGAGAAVTNYVGDTADGGQRQNGRRRLRPER
jgi:phage terminase large subunit-like protein